MTDVQKASLDTQSVSLHPAALIYARDMAFVYKENASVTRDMRETNATNVQWDTRDTQIVSTTLVSPIPAMLMDSVVRDDALVIPDMTERLATPVQTDLKAIPIVHWVTCVNLIHVMEKAAVLMVLAPVTPDMQVFNVTNAQKDTLVTPIVSTSAVIPIPVMVTAHAIKANALAKRDM